MICLPAICLCGVICLPAAVIAQSQPATTSQPLNGTVSDFGTSFIFSPPPVCPGCVETELGLLSLSDGRYLPAVATVALPKGHTDVSVLLNVLDSESAQNDRVTHFGNRLDFVVRQQVAAKGGFVMTLAPRGTIFIRGGDGGRAGATAAPQYSWGKNLAVMNITWTGGVGVSSGNPRNDYLTSFDYYRLLDQRGTSFFAGAQQEYTAGSQSADIEQGLVIPFRNGQVELATEQLDLNANIQVQFQARVIVNWGKVFGRRSLGN